MMSKNFVYQIVKIFILLFSLYDHKDIVVESLQLVHRSVGISLRSRLSPFHGLRSATTSEELKKNSQFRVVGKWSINENQHVGTKLPEYLHLIAPIMFSTKTSSKNAVRRGLIRLNGLKAQNTDILAEDDVIESFERSEQGSFCDNKANTGDAKFKKVPVLWEDDHVAVVIKPQGMLTFRAKEQERELNSSIDSSSDSFSCLYTALPYSLTPVPSDAGLKPLRRPRAVHRLDKGTGGLVIIAKTRDSLVNLSAQFAAHTIKKTYQAIVVGKLNETTSSPTPTVEAEGSIFRELSGQSALTDWFVPHGMYTESSIYGTHICFLRIWIHIFVGIFLHVDVYLCIFILK
jgi:23S rRNA-/tRNA-specific pseudouridylate synthase